MTDVPPGLHHLGQASKQPLHGCDRLTGTVSSRFNCSIRTGGEIGKLFGLKTRYIRAVTSRMYGTISDGPKIIEECYAFSWDYAIGSEWVQRKSRSAV